MPESSIVVRPEPMDSGSYTASSRLQAAGLPAAIAIFEKAAEAVPLPKQPQPIVIADYGASNGHNSLLPMGAAIAMLRKRTRHDHSILVVHTDLPDNDFTAMFKTLAEDPDSYLGKDKATFASAVGRSFYAQIVPSNSVNLGWSSWAIQWLRRAPAPIPDHIHVAYSSDERVKAEYARQAAHDWHEFVAFRGRELAPGGRMVVMTPGVDESGAFGYNPLMDSMYDTVTELAAAGVITEDEKHRMALPIAGRSATDFRACFAPSGRFENLEIEQLDLFNAEDRFFKQYQIDKDAKAFGAQWAGFCRAAAFPTFAGALEGGHADPRRGTFFDQLEEGVASRLAAAPEQTQIPMANVVLVKRQSK
ncbi:SAM-dependent methyltransferase [Mycobacterium sp. NPDC051804]|uniref:SAM-dependent methyltransferase n=1 Tax=Mycobacterium sp. NPDC051804 TaxID=3364295 RepID=UPI0037A8B241